MFIVEDITEIEKLEKEMEEQKLTSLKNILLKHKLQIFHVKKLFTHGGSLRFFIKKNKNNKIKI